MIPRAQLDYRLRRSLRNAPVTVLYGPRQCGKTTLAREIARTTQSEYFDLEDPIGQRRLSEPLLALRELRGLIVIDEVHRKPDLFPLLRVLADRRPLPARFLILGSASPDLLRQSSETLAGRIEFLEMSGFNLSELGATAQRRLWWRGGFPRSFLARSDSQSLSWRENFIQTFLERDIREFGIQIPPITLRRLWMMLAHYSAQTWNSSEISRSLGEGHTTVKRHLDLLTGALMVRQLQPWYENLAKRQIKSPKIYIRDSGLLHALLGVPSLRALSGHPKVGASWEGFVIEQIVDVVGARNCYFWATQAGAELDLLVLKSGKRYGVEIKYRDAPSVTKSMHIAIADLALEYMFVVYPGDESYSLHDRIEVVPVEEVRKRFASKNPLAK